MGQSTVVDKGRRLLASSRVQVRYADQDTVVGRVLGDSGVTHEVRWDRGRWVCSCPAFGTCSHQEAISQVTMRPVVAGVSDIVDSPHITGQEQ